MDRRQAIRVGMCGALAIPSLPAVVLAEWRRAVASGSTAGIYLDAALRAERWIRSVAIDTSAGRSWPVTPGDARRGKPDPFLYSGAPGVILFYLDLHAHTGEKRFLDEAIAGALELASLIPPASARATQVGLYAGIAGQAVVLDKVAQAAGRADLREVANRAATLVAARFNSPTPGTNEVTDIVSGTAGSGLALLSLQHLIGDQAIAAARHAGDRLLASSLPAADGARRWMMSPIITRELPNFSHGTAGVAFFLATLAQPTREKKYLDAALEGVRHLESLMVPSGSGTVIRHTGEDEGKDRFYLSWCHGPAGNARLWERMRTISGDAKWRGLEDAGARGIIGQGVPEKRPAGFWENVSQCCGNAGVAEYFIERYRRSGDAADLAYAQRHADDLLKRGTVDADRERWIQAENRVSPNDLSAQTGWMQGAAGVGAMLLHLDAAIAKSKVRRASVLPDSPWPA